MFNVEKQVDQKVLVITIDIQLLICYNITCGLSESSASVLFLHRVKI